MCLADGRRVVPLASAQDHKRVGDGDTGPNTGGMGAFSPGAGGGRAPRASGCARRWWQPTLHELRRRGIDYRGVLYAGLMLTARRSRRARVQRALRRSRGAGGAAPPRRRRRRPARRGGRRCAAHGAARSVPTPPSPWCARRRATRAAPRTGDVIDGLDAAGAVPGRDRLLRRCRRGTRRPPRHRRRAGAGRHRHRAPTVDEARAAAYEGVGRLSWPGLHRRSDIAVARESPR